MPSIDRAAEICEALDLEFYVGPAREGGGRRGVFAESFEARTLRGGEVEVDGERARGLAWFSRSRLDRNNRRPTSRRDPPLHSFPSPDLHSFGPCHRAEHTLDKGKSVSPDLHARHYSRR